MPLLLNGLSLICTSAIVNRRLLTQTYLIDFKIFERNEPECFNPNFIL